MKLTHLQLRNWKSFSRVVVELGDRVFVVGPNASGKSNLLDALRFLRDVAAPDGGLQRAVADRGGVDAVRFLGAAADAEVAIGVAIEGERTEESWMYELAFTDAEDGTALVTRESVRGSGARVLHRPDEDDENDPRQLRQTALEQVSANRAFRVVADFLTQIAYLHLAPELLRDHERVRPRPKDPLGSDLLERVLRTPKSAQAKRMERINDVLRVTLPYFDRVDVESTGASPHLWMRFKQWRSTAAAQNERQLSDGTLRLFGFLWAILDGNGPLLLEEPELSLHPGVVRHLASFLRGESSRQTFISTHSLDFLSDEGIAPEEVLLLEPTANGTDVHLASDDAQIQALLEGGVPIADAVLPGTAPPRAIEMLRSGSKL